LKYRAWGEVRYSSGTPIPDYTFTGQYSNVDDFGLMFFNARWYDPALGRFAQADTVIPEASQGTQAWDRFVYVNNSPLNFVDPTGHDWEEIIFNRTGAMPRSRWEPLPEPKDIVKGYNFPGKPDTFEGSQEEFVLYINNKTLEYYKIYREWLIKNGHGHMLDGNGWIRDKTLITLVINSEFGPIKEQFPDVYEAALSALSFQFANNAYTFQGEIICGHSCPDATAQLVWLQAFQGMRSPAPLETVKDSNGWTTYIPDALRVMAEPFGDYTSWGNYGGVGLCIPYYSFCVR